MLAVQLSKTARPCFLLFINLECKNLQAIKLTMDLINLNV